MRKNPTKRIEPYRIKSGPLASQSHDGANGAFQFRVGPLSVRVVVIVSDGTDWDHEKLGPTVWEHVSVSCQSRCPTWEEMDAVKRIFWRDDETVLQFHVPRSDHINVHDNCLHLWKPVGVEIPRPPAECV